MNRTMSLWRQPGAGGWGDCYTRGPRSFFCLHEKGGRYNVVPAHHTAQEYVDAYLEAANITEDRRGPLFRRTGPGPRDALLVEGLTRHADLPEEISLDEIERIHIRGIVGRGVDGNPTETAQA